MNHRIRFQSGCIMKKSKRTLLILILILLTAFYTSGMTVRGQTQTPLYAFNGAYAVYNITFVYNSTSIAGTVSFNITNVDVATQTFNVSTSYSGFTGSLSALNTYTPSTASATFNNPSPFLAVNQSDLQMLNKGQTPPDMAGGTVTTGVSLSVPAGTFKTDEVAISGNTSWIQASSGLLIKETGSFQGFSSVTLVLQSTNILRSVLLGIVIIVAIIVVVVAVIFLMFRRRKLKKRTRIPPPPQAAPQYPSPPPSPLQSQPLPAVPLTIPTPKIMQFCGNCGAQLQQGVKFCANCGASAMPSPQAIYQQATPVPQPTQPAQQYPIPPPPPPPENVPLCTTCGNPLIYVHQYSRWYCTNCKKYQ